MEWQGAPLYREVLRALVTPGLETLAWNGPANRRPELRCAESLGKANHCLAQQTLVKIGMELLAWNGEVHRTLVPLSTASIGDAGHGIAGVEMWTGAIRRLAGQVTVKISDKILAWNCWQCPALNTVEKRAVALIGKAQIGRAGGVSQCESHIHCERRR